VKVDPEASRRSKPKHPSRRLLYALGLAAIFIVSFLSSTGGLLHQFELRSIDARFKLRGERPPSGDVALVLIDETSLMQLGQWPWSREVHARMIRELKKAGAKVIVFDVMFVEKASDPTEDTELAQAIKQAGNVILAAFSPTGGPAVEAEHTTMLGRFAMNPREVANRQRAIDAPGLRGPVASLADHVSGIGLAMSAPDPDGTMRRGIVAVYNEADQKLYPSLALAAAQKAIGVQDGDISVDFADGMKLSDAAFIPFVGRGQAMINFSGGRGARPHYSYVDILNGRLQRNEFVNKVVLVGIGAHGLYDVHPNPFSPDFLGPEFNADFIENIMSSNFLSSASSGTNTLLLIILGLLVTYISATLRPITAAGVSAVAIVVFIAAAIYAFIGAGVVVAVVAPTIAAILAYTLITLRRLTSEERSRARLRKYFASYAPPEVVDDLDAGIMEDKMAGIEDEITVLFSDIRGFTSIGSTMEARRLVRMLNLYFTAMTEVVFDFGGTVDKFIGDGLLVLYNALSEQPDHARRAVFTAIEMIERVERLNKEWADEDFPEIRIGVGVHTGNAVVGNLGPEIRMDYTAIGSTVSLASRVEGLNKDLKTQILITEDTLKQLEGLVEVRPMGPIDVRGIPEPVEIYEVLGFKGQTNDSETASTA